MDRQIENEKVKVKTETTSGAKRAYSSGHLMCRTPLWGVAGFLGCAYFAWISFSHVTRNEYDWPHDLWTAATYVVWILPARRPWRSTRAACASACFSVCWSSILSSGCGLTLWRNVPSADVRSARIGTGALWALAALVSLTTLRGAPELRGKGTDFV